MNKFLRIRSKLLRQRSEYVHWNKYNLWWYLRNEVAIAYGSYFLYPKVTTQIAGPILLSNILCVMRPKQSALLIWTIGFEVGHRRRSR